MLPSPRFKLRLLVPVVCSIVVAGGPAMAAIEGSVSARLEQAAEMIRDGRLVEAKASIVRIDMDSLSPDQRERAMELLGAAERRLRNADPVDISLQKASLALEDGDVRSAERHASGARSHDRATREQRAEAQTLLQDASSLKADLQPLAIAALRQAVADFDAGRYAEAKAGFDSVYRSGCDLDADGLRMLESHRAQIFEIERQQGSAFELDYTPLGMLQPGRVERTGDPLPSRGGDAPANEPVAQAAPQSGGGSGAMAQSEQSAPPPAPEPSMGDDVFQEALRFDAERFLAEADAAFDDGRFNEAEQKYSLVTTTYREHVTAEELSHAEQRLAETRVMLSTRSGTLLEEFAGTRDIIRQQTIAEYDNLMQQAEAALTEGDFERARSQAGRARITIAQKREVFSEGEYDERAAKVDTLLERVRNSEEATRLAEVEERGAEVARQSREAEAQQRADRDRKIVEALDRVRTLQLEQKYEEALQVVDQVLFLDPNNPAGLLLRDVLRDVVIWREYHTHQREKAYSYATESNAIQHALVIPQEIMNFPSDWPEISFRRGEPIAFVDTEEDRRVLAELETRRIPATFANNTLEDVLTFVATVTNLNMDVNWDSLADIGIERDTEVTLNLRPVPVKVLLERVLEKVSPDEFSRAGWATEDGVLVVAAEDTLRRKTFIKIYDVRDLIFQVPDFPDVPELDLDTVLQQGSQRGGGGRGGGGIFQDPEEISVEQILQDEDDTLTQLVDIIQTNVDFDGWQANGGQTGFIQELNGNLIITNTAANHRDIVGLLRQLREVRAIQINVEARFLSVAQDFFEQIGFDLDVYFNAKNNQYQEAQAQQEFFLGTGSRLNPSPQGSSVTYASDLVGARSRSITQYFLQAEDETTGEITYQFNPLPFSINAPDPLSIIPVQSNSKGIAENLIAAGGFAAQIASLNPALGIAATFLDDIQVDLLIEATQADRRNVTLTAPRLTFFNGKFANIFVATQQSFVSDLTPIVGTSAVAFDPTVSPLTTGVTLLLRGAVSADRRYVTLMINSRVASLVRFDPEIQVEAAAGGVGDGSTGSAATGTIQVPVISISAIATGATVPDQGTILLGGQRSTTEAEIEAGVPVLSKIPIINRFFVNRIESKEEQTLLILLKPTIIIQHEEEEKNFPGLLDSLGSGLGSYGG